VLKQRARLQIRIDKYRKLVDDDAKYEDSPTQFKTHDEIHDQLSAAELMNSNRQGASAAAVREHLANMDAAFYAQLEKFRLRRKVRESDEVTHRTLVS